MSLAPPQTDWNESWCGYWFYFQPDELYFEEGDILYISDTVSVCHQSFQSVCLLSCPFSLSIDSELQFPPPIPISSFLPPFSNVTRVQSLSLRPSLLLFVFSFCLSLTFFCRFSLFVFSFLSEKLMQERCIAIASHCLSVILRVTVTGGKGPAGDGLASSQAIMVSEQTLAGLAGMKMMWENLFLEESCS